MLVKVNPDALLAEGGPDFGALVDPSDGGLGPFVKGQLDLGNLLGTRELPGPGGGGLGEDPLGGLGEGLLGGLAPLELGDLLSGLLGGLLGGQPAQP